MRRSACRFLAVLSLIATAATGEPAARPRYGGTLRVQMRVSAESLDLRDDSLASLVFDRLVILDEHDRPAPALAVDWQHDAEKKRWQFRLRSGVKFHDGTPVEPAAVAEALRATASGESVVFQFDRPRPGLLLELSGVRGSIFRRTADGAFVGSGPFRVTAWEPHQRAIFSANEEHWAGRPFVDAVEIHFGRQPREQAIDLEVGKADLVEVSPGEVRRLAQRGIKTWTSRPAELLVVTAALDDARLREAVALSIDRAGIHGVLLQRQGEVAGGLLPQWLSGYAFLFSTGRDLERARQLAAGAQPRSLLLAYDPSDPVARLVADRVVVNAREAGIALRTAPEAAMSHLTLRRHRITSADAASLPVLLKSSISDAVTPEEAYEAERTAINSFVVIPIVHLADIYGLGPRVRNWRGWRLDQVWLEVEGP